MITALIKRPSNLLIKIYRNRGLLLKTLLQLSYFIKSLIWPFTRKNDWVFIGELQDWSINHDGKQTLDFLNNNNMNTRHVYYPAFLNSRIIHFGSLNAYKPSSKRLLCFSEYIILTCFHGDFGISDEMDEKLNVVLGNINDIGCLVVSNEIMKCRFIQWGFPENKIKLIPIGVNTSIFNPATNTEKKGIKQLLHLPDEHYIIGSFQKDGNGWNEGNEPKLIKGPDIFCNVVEAISQELPIHVLLTGPARGYVKQRLNKAGISFTHHLLASPDEIAQYYKAIDCYLMCSREEGGPKALPESLSTATPIVATRTGMAPDIEKEFNGWFCDVDDQQALINLTRDALTNQAKRNSFEKLAPAYATKYSWQNLGKTYLNLYESLIKNV